MIEATFTTPKGPVRKVLRDPQALRPTLYWLRERHGGKVSVRSTRDAQNTMANRAYAERNAAQCVPRLSHLD